MADKNTGKKMIAHDGCGLSEGFDFGGISDTDYTDTFADMDQAAEELAEFERALASTTWCYGGQSDVPRRYGDRFDDPDVTVSRVESGPDEGMYEVSVNASEIAVMIIDLNSMVPYAAA